MSDLIELLQTKINLALPDLGFNVDDLEVSLNGGKIKLSPKLGADLTGLNLNPFSIFSFNPTEGLLKVDFGFDAETSTTRPFNLNLGDLLGVPALNNIISVEASGDLGVEAAIDLNLSLGLDIVGEDKGFFIDVDETYLDASARAYGNNLDFDAQLGPIGIYVVDGAAHLTGKFGIKLTDAGVSNTDDRLYILGYGDGSFTSDLDDVGDFIDTSDLSDYTSGLYLSGTGTATLPLYFGLESSPIPMGDPSVLRDFGVSDPPSHFTGSESLPGNVLGAHFDLLEIFNGSSDGNDGFEIRPPDFDFNSLQLPSLFALLSDPLVIVNGLNRVLKEIQGVLEGELFGFEIPLLGDLLADNPVANFIEDFRLDFLQPLAKTLTEANVTLDGLINLLKGVIFDVFSTKLGILDPAIAAANQIADMFLDADGNPTDFLSAEALQIEFDLGDTINLSPDDPIVLDLGIPALGLDAELQPNLILEWNLHFGFGIDLDNGFYFVSHYDDPSNGAGQDPELQISINMDLGSTHLDRGANIKGNLLFLALEITDGVDLDKDGLLEFGPATPSSIEEFKASEFSRVYISASIDIVDPNDDGKLTLPELFTQSPLKTFVFDVFGGVLLRAEAEVNLGGLDSGGTSLSNALPSIRTDILVDFAIGFNSLSGLDISPPDVALANISLDLGDFIGGFAGDLLDGIKDVLEPLDWLIGPDGLLNMRLPLISDLLGERPQSQRLPRFCREALLAHRSCR